MQNRISASQKKQFSQSIKNSPYLQNNLFLKQTTLEFLSDSTKDGKTHQMQNKTEKRESENNDANDNEFLQKFKDFYEPPKQSKKDYIKLNKRRVQSAQATPSKSNSLTNYYKSRTMASMNSLTKMNQSLRAYTQQQPKTTTLIKPQPVQTQPSYSMGRNKRSFFYESSPMQKNIPGVGSYNIDKTNFSKTFYTINPQRKDIFHPMYKKIPGPGTYEPKKQARSNSVKFGKELRKSNQSLTTSKTNIKQGYDEYQAFFQKVIKRNPQTKFTNQKRNLISETIFNNKHNYTPAGANYQNVRYNSKAPKVGLTGKGITFLQQILKTNITPGSSKYTPNKIRVLKKNPSFSFGTSKKYSSIQTSPGPGDYNIGRDNLGPQWGLKKYKLSNSQYSTILK